MSRIVSCPSCGQKNRLPEESSGRRVRCGRCQTELTTGGGEPVTATDAEFAQLVAAHPRLLVDFWAAWCGPCRTVAPILDDISRSRSDVVVAKLDVDANPATASRFSVSSIPTMIFFRDGREVGREIGALPRPRIESAITRHLGV